jgi:CPA2 family monovalent cation:H+ antiporter-2
MGVLLFQDLAVVPLLILIPSFSESAGTDGDDDRHGDRSRPRGAVAGIVLWPAADEPWFLIVARGKSAELFMLNVLLVTLGMAYVTELAGLSLALGAFVAGMLISETQYRHHVEEDIKPFRDVLMGLFFVTIGMMLDAPLVLANLPLVLGVLAALLAVKFALMLGLSRLFGAAPGSALRSGLWLCAGGEFGFVLLSEMGPLRLVPPLALQAVLAALVISMLLAPIIVQYSNRIVLRFAASEWLMRSMQLTQLAAQTMNTEKHVVICGYGRSGQHLARFMEQEAVAMSRSTVTPNASARRLPVERTSSTATPLAAKRCLPRASAVPAR